MRVFGKAADFYRLRVLKLSEDSGLELDWDPAILHSTPVDKGLETTVWYALQAVSIDTEQSYILKRFADPDAALRYRDKVDEILSETTKQAFEERFGSVDFSRRQP